MKNKFLLILIIPILSFLNSCDSDDSNLTHNTIISAGKYEFDLGVIVNTSNSIDIDIYTNDIVGSDRTFNLMISEESTGTSADYTVPSSVTIPANENKATISVQAMDVTNTLIIEIEEQSGVYAAEDIVINILKVCPFDINDFVGTYDAIEDGQYNYVVTVELGTDNQLILKNLYETAGTTILNVDTTDPDNPEVSFPSFGNGGVLYVSGTYGNVYAVNPSTFGSYGPADDTSSIDPCDSSMSLAFVRQVAAGIFSNIVKVELTKQ